jgi:hypothetical protein
MANNNHKSWSEQYGRYIYKDGNGDWMIDAFGPTDELSILRELHKVLENLKYEQSTLSPKGPVPTDEGSRFIAYQKGDLDAIHFVLLEEEINYVKEFIQQISDGKKGGRPGMDQTIFLKDLQTAS